MSISLTDIYRYPVKGMSAEPLPAVTLTAGEGLPHDRRFAITHGASQFQPGNPGWQPKRQFVVLMTHERLAALETRFDDGTGVLTVCRDGKRVARGAVTTPIGKDLINQFLAAFMKGKVPGTPKLVEAPGVMFTDCKDKLVSLISLASLRDLERVARRPVDARRFRANLVIDGLRPWQEFDWVGRDIAIGEARLRVVERIQRCAATSVDPETAERDLNVPKLLTAGFDHCDFGVYAEVIAGGRITVGDPVTLPD